MLSVGLGTWGGAITNPSNPQRRDVQIVPASGYAVRSSSPFHSTPFTHTIIHPLTRTKSHLLTQPSLFLQVFQWQQNNPGVWPFHCHVAWHVSGGLYANIMERPTDIENLLIPSTAYQNCRDWADFSGGNLLPQIDSGL